MGPTPRPARSMVSSTPRESVSNLTWQYVVGLALVEIVVVHFELQMLQSVVCDLSESPGGFEAPEVAPRWKMTKDWKHLGLILYKRIDARKSWIEFQASEFWRIIFPDWELFNKGVLLIVFRLHEFEALALREEWYEIRGAQIRDTKLDDEVRVLICGFDDRS